MSDDTRQIGKYMTAQRVPHEPHDIWIVRNSHSRSILALVEWYKPWRRYVLSPDENTVYSHDCLTALAAFVRGLDEEANNAK